MNHLQSQANALLYRALQLPQSTRQQYLDGACGGRRDLFELVNGMLAHIDQLDALLEDPLAARLDAEQRDETVRLAPDDRVGRWRVLRELERDRLGAELLVTGEDGQRGLLRTVDPSALGLAQLALYQRERQLLASLTHPDIARLIDSGALPDGQPYVVAEHPDGLPIDQFCAQQHLAPDARLALVIRVAQALHHAHQRLVVHGRLAPACILVDRAGAPKVGGFGRAGAAHTTFTDIHALGLILQGLAADGANAALRAIIDKAVYADRAEPAPQYPSMEALARDLQHYLQPSPAPQQHTPAPAPATPRRRPLAAIVAALLIGLGAGAAAGWMAGVNGPARPQPPLAELAPTPTTSAPAAPENAASTRSAVEAAGRHLRDAEARRSAGDLIGARASVQAAIDLSAAHLADGSARARHADALQLGGAVLIEQGAAAQGLAQLRKALAMREELGGEAAGVDERAAIARSRVALADGLVLAGAYPEADSAYALARAFYTDPLTQSAGAAAAVHEIDLARANAQYLRKHWRTAGQTVRAVRAALPAGADAVLKARAAFLEALLQPGGTAAQAYATARQALPTLLADYERDPANVPKLRESALVLRRTGEIAARAGQAAQACDYYSRADKRYTELEYGNRLNELDKVLREQLGALRANCS